MSTRPFLPPNSNKPIVNAADMSGGTVTSPATIIQMLPGISYSLVWTGTPTGTFSVQVSNDYSQNDNGTIRNAGTWNTLPSSAFTGTYPAPSGSAGNGFLDVVGCNAYAVRIVYNGSGAGNLTVIPCSKVL